MNIGTTYLTRHQLVAAAVLTALIVISPLGVTMAFADSGHILDDGRFTPNAVGNTWPPQPRNVQNERLYTPIDPASASRRRSSAGQVGAHTAIAQEFTGANAATGVALASTQVTNELGDNFAHIGTASIDDKSTRTANQFLVTFFSHSRNQTVTAVVAQGVLHEVSTTPAAADQPPLADSEKTRAIALARNYWQDLGNARIGHLTGFAIQTYQADSSFYGTRLVYVSFHTSQNHTPELLTWVDLTNQSIVRGVMEQVQ